MARAPKISAAIAGQKHPEVALDRLGGLVTVAHFLSIITPLRQFSVVYRCQHIGAELRMAIAVLPENLDNHGQPKTPDEVSDYT